MNYNPQASAKSPVTLRIPDLARGTFPHRFNRRENWNGEKPVPHPSLEEFGYAYLNEKDKQELGSWYDEDSVRKNELYDFRRKFKEYCRMDEQNLRLYCQQFRSIFTPS